MTDADLEARERGITAQVDRARNAIDTCANTARLNLRRRVAAERALAEARGAEPEPKVETSDRLLRRTPREEFAAMARDELDGQLRAAQYRDDPRVSVDVIHLGRLLARYDVLEHHATRTAAAERAELTAELRAIAANVERFAAAFNAPARRRLFTNPGDPQRDRRTVERWPDAK